MRSTADKRDGQVGGSASSSNPLVSLIVIPPEVHLTGTRTLAKAADSLLMG